MDKPPGSRTTVQQSGRAAASQSVGRVHHQDATFGPPIFPGKPTRSCAGEEEPFESDGAGFEESQGFSYANVVSGLMVPAAAVGAALLAAEQNIPSRVPLVVQRTQQIRKKAREQLILPSDIRGIVRLENPTGSNSCYANAVVTLLLEIREFRDFLHTVRHLSDVSKTLLDLHNNAKDG